jgi:hypothetical protein
MFKLFRKKEVLSENELYRRKSKIGGLPVSFFGYEDIYLVCQKITNLMHRYNLDASNEKIKIIYSTMKIRGVREGKSFIYKEIADFQHIAINNEKIDLKLLREPELITLLNQLKIMHSNFASKKT